MIRDRAIFLDYAIAHEQERTTIDNVAQRTTGSRACG